MAPFTFASLSETFYLLMNTPLVLPDASKAPRDVPLTEMPSRLDRDSRRRSNSSTISTSTQSSTFSAPGSRDGYLGPNWSRESSFSTTVSRSPPSPLIPASKRLPPLPSDAISPPHSRVRFAEDLDAAES